MVALGVSPGWLVQQRLSEGSRPGGSRPGSRLLLLTGNISHFSASKGKAGHLRPHPLTDGLPSTERDRLPDPPAPPPSLPAASVACRPAVPTVIAVTPHLQGEEHELRPAGWPLPVGPEQSLLPKPLGAQALLPLRASALAVPTACCTQPPSACLDSPCSR